MSTDITFEELEKTAFEFAKSLAVNNVKTGFSLEAMERAMQWHAESALRKSWYINKKLKKSEWLTINTDSDYDDGDFIKGNVYWVINQHMQHEPFQAVFEKIQHYGSRSQPLFVAAADDYTTFQVDKYLPASISSDILAENPPKNPNPQQQQTEQPLQKKHYATAGSRTF